MKNQVLYCIQCKKIQSDSSLLCSFCKGYYSLLAVSYTYEKPIKSLDALYAHFLPFKLFKKNDFTNCSLAKYSKNIWLKNEGENVGKSVKEKEIIVGVKVAKHLGYKNMSFLSGGSGIQVANYFIKKKKAPITLYSPIKTSKNISKQIKIGEDYEDTFKKVLSQSDYTAFNITPGINPYSQEGGKVISWQIIEKKIPFDSIVVPCGNGSILWGIYKGFEHAYKEKLIDRITPFYSVELKNGPIAGYLKTGKIGKNNSILHSKAVSIDVKESFCLQKAVMAIKASGGEAGIVTEKEIEEAYKKLHRKKIKALFTAAAALAFAKKLSRKYPSQKICAVLTGSE